MINGLCAVLNGKLKRWMCARIFPLMPMDEKKLSEPFSVQLAALGKPHDLLRIEIVVRKRSSGTLCPQNGDDKLTAVSEESTLLGS
jgi:hypothetical protein